MNSKKNLSLIASPSLYFLYICLLLPCLSILLGCSTTKAEVDSQKQNTSEQSLADSDPRKVATTSSHLLANRIGNQIYKNLDGKAETEENKTDFTPLNKSFTPLSNNKIADNTPSRVGEITSFSPTEDTRIVSLQERRASKVNVTCTVRVYKLLPEDRRGRKHQRFLVKLSNNTTVLVAHNIDLAPRLPLKVSDIVEIRGEYIWNEKGGVLHYTHRSTSRRKQGGYIVLNGKKYQ